jgi:hypothetical protein
MMPPHGPLPALRKHPGRNSIFHLGHRLPRPHVAAVFGAIFRSGISSHSSTDWHLASALAITWAASTFFFGALSDRIGRRRVLIPAVFIFSILSWMTGLAHSFHQLLLIRALMGIAEGPTWSIMTALIEVIASQPPRTKHRVGRQCGRACGSSGCSRTNHSSSRALGLAAGFLCRRHAGIADGLSDLEIRARASTRRRPGSCETVIDGLLFDPAPSKYLAMLSGSDRVYVLVVRVKRLRSALHNRGSASGSDHRGVLAGRERSREFFPWLSASISLRPHRTEASATDDGAHVRGRASRLPCARPLCLPSLVGRHRFCS